MTTTSADDRPIRTVLVAGATGFVGRHLSPALVEAGYLVRTRADADVVAPNPATRDVALASGAQIVHTDFPAGESQLGSGYVVSFGTRLSARCNPVLTTPASCTAAAAVEPG